ncbi:MAG: acyl-CoA/acyl-ACP dehydrogenase [Myxococcota bacterium]|nr:acyl-CoA/acyl-ACP dehydrogenase [Myxococcota bacterium]
MIDFELGDELELVRHTARTYADDHLRPALRDHEAKRTPAPTSQKAFAEIGFASLEWPEADDEPGLGALGRFLVLEELAAADPGAALALDPLGPALYPLLELGGADALTTFGAPLLETAGSRALLVWNGPGTRLPLRKTGDTLSGSVPWVPADHADLVVVLDEEGAAVVKEGLEFKPLRGSGLRAAGASEMTLRESPVVAAWQGKEPAARALARARLYVSALLVGVMRESSDYSRRYALDRVAFGRPIAHHQALAFLITDMVMAVDSARMLAWEAAWRLDSGLDAEEACATAFLEAAEQAIFVTPNGVQILGGHGFMQDHPVEKYMREGRTLGLFLGGVDTARLDASRGFEESSGASLLPLGVAE